MYKVCRGSGWTKTLTDLCELATAHHHSAGSVGKRAVSCQKLGHMIDCPLTLPALGSSGCHILLALGNVGTTQQTIYMIAEVPCIHTYLHTPAGSAAAAVILGNYPQLLWKCGG